MHRSIPLHIPYMRPCAAILLALTTFGLPARADAGLILNAEVRVSVEDNIVGLLSGDGDATGTGTAGGMQAPARAGAGSGTGKGFGSGSGASDYSGKYTGDGSRSPGDLSVTAFAEAGGYADTGDHLSFFAKGFAERTDYHEYSEYDQSVAGIVAGLTAFIGDRLSAGLSGFDKVQRYDNDPDRDSTARGGTITLKQRLGPSFWLRESAEYETSRAAYQDFTYRGAAVRLRAGYDATNKLLLLAGYGFQSRQYQDIDRTVLRTGTASLGADYAFSRRWSSGLAYDRDATAATSTDVVTRNNIVSFSLRYSY